MKHFYLTLSGLVFTAAAAFAAQPVVETSPAIVQTDSRDIVVTFYADRGSGELKGQPSTAALYAHTGVITNKSTGPTDWQYAPKWGDNSAKYKLTYVSPDVWTLTIPSIAEYYGVPANETVSKLAFVFRNSTGSLTGKTVEGGDIFVDVHAPGFSMTLTSGRVVTDSNPVSLTVDASEKATLTLAVNGETLATEESAMTLTRQYSFTTAGDYQVTATGKLSDGSEMSVNSLFVRVGGAMQADYPGGIPQPGAVRTDDGSVLFCLPAPQKNSVVVVGSWNDYLVSTSGEMNYQDYQGARYFWTSVSGLEENRDYIYYYIVDGNVRVGDPYARLVLDPYNDRYISSDVFPDMPAYPSDKVQDVPLAVYNSSRDDYEWRYSDDFTRPDRNSLVIYELLIRDFSGVEGESRGSGTIAGVLKMLDYLKNLGVNAIELMPIMEFGGNNSWGYNTNFYFAPDKAYGTPDDYRRLIDEAHGRGMAVILDIVFNQSDGLHPWYQMYPADKNPFYNATAPHAYSVLNDWNQDNDLVMRQWRDALSYWLTAYRVDGFRFDLVKGLGNNDSYGNTYDPSTNTWGTPSEANTNAYNRTRVDRMAELHAWMRTICPDAYFINENLAMAREENEMAADGDLNWANVNNASCQFAMGWQSDSSLDRFYAPFDERLWGSTVSYAESHDEERMAYKQERYGATGVKGNLPVEMRRLGSVAAQMLMTPGSHMIWQFQEFGADQTTKNGSGNDTSPKRVVWSYLSNPDRHGLKDTYRDLCFIRRNNTDLFTETATADVKLSGWTDRGRTLTLSNGESRLILLVNPLVSEKAAVKIPDGGSSENLKVMTSSYGVGYQLAADGVTLEPGAFIVLGTDDLSGIGETLADDANRNISVSGGDGCIIVTGNSGPVRAYNLMGCETGLDGLSPGVYIVEADGRGYKVRVR